MIRQLKSHQEHDLITMDFGVFFNLRPRVLGTKTRKQIIKFMYGDII